MPGDLAILRCPITYAGVQAIDSDQLAELNERIERGEVRTVGGELIEHPLADAIVTAGARYIYPVEDGIYVMLAERAIDRALQGAADRGSLTLGETKVELQDFYDRVGWQPGASAFTDTELFEDLRAVSEQYLHACHRRVSRHLPSTGKYLLDAGSGPIAHEDYLQYSAGYDLRICVDFSITALREIKRKLGDRALCVLADVTNLPFHDGSVDAAISLHTIYHVPQAEQRKAFTELHRVLVPAGRGVIVYSWGESRPVRLVHGPLTARTYTRAAATALRRSLGKAEPTEQTASDANPNLYFAPISYRWFVAQRWPFEYEILTWRSLSVRALQAYVPDSPRGEKMLRWLERIEDRFPALAGRWGQYPLIAIRKPP